MICEFDESKLCSRCLSFLRNDIFARSKYEPEHELDAAIKKVGYDIKDVKMIVIGHLHLDHAGGLDAFKGTDIPIWVHKEELLSGFYSIATGECLRDS